MPFIIAIAVILIIYLFLVFPGRAPQNERSLFEGRNFAHRGLYDNEKGIPENSLPAFRAAMQAGYGCELDVQFTKDEQLIVFHDNDYKRACGVDKPVWELTLEEAKQLKLFGTDETIPTFREVLDTVNGQNPLIVEIKAEELDTKWYSKLCEATRKALEDYNGVWCVESFHPFVVRWMWKHMPNVVRGLLVGGLAEKGTPAAFIVNSVAHMLFNFYCRPQFIAYNHRKRLPDLKIAKRLGAFSVMWTVDTPEDQDRLEKEEDAIIFEHYLPDIYYKNH